MTSSSTNQQFSSDGFDLDAVSAAADEVVYEVGGGVSAVPDAKEGAPQSTGDGGAKDGETNEGGEKIHEEEDPCSASDSHKAEGNGHFKAGEYLDAYDCYTSAIEACPGPFNGEDLLKQRDEHDEKERARIMERHREETDRKRKEEEERYRRKRDGEAGDEKKQGASAEGSDDKGNGEDDDENKKAEAEKEKRRAEFVPPHHPHCKKLSVYHCNRGACSLALSRDDESVQDCTVAILLNKSYTKAYLRRMAAYEAVDKTEEALQDAKTALFYEPNSANARRNVKRLEKIEAERMEKLKEETMGKLKDLGNSILGNFGMSLDNFKTEQDPKTGGYSISFNQNG